MNTAMILAAGRGTRLKSITETIPKSLCTVQKIPLIEHHIKNLVRYGLNRIVINHAYLGSKIRHHLKEGRHYGANIHYCPEPPGGLETGGGIVNALPLLGTDPFVVINADIFCHYDFSLLQARRNEGVHLVLVDKEISYPRGDFGLDEHARVNNGHEYTFSGIATYHPEIFQEQPIGRYSIVPLIRALAEKQKVTGEIYQGKWIDIGTPERLKKANQPD